MVGGGSTYTPELVDSLCAHEDRLVVDELGIARIYDSKGKLRTTSALTNVPLVKKGTHSVKFNATFEGDDHPPRIKVTFKTKGTGEPVKKN